MLTFNFCNIINVIIYSWVLYTVFICLFISFHFVIDGNEIVANDQLNDGVDNCRSKAKLVDGDKVVEEPKNGMMV